MTTGQIIRKLREEREWTQEQLAEMMGYKHKSSIQKIEADKSDPSQPKLKKLATLFNVTPSYLLGYDDEPQDNQNITPLPNDKVIMVPVFDSVSAGFGAFPQDYIKEYIPTYINCPSDHNQYMWINVTGDSMYPTIEDGSNILIRKQTSVDSGQIAVVLIDNEEAVVKRVVYGTDWIELQSINPQYPPRRFKGAEVKKIKILGLVKQVSKDLQ